MNNILIDYLDDFYITYLNNILIYFKNPEDYKNILRKYSKGYKK